MRKNNLKIILGSMLLCLNLNNAQAGKPREFVSELSCSARPDNYYQDVKNGLFISTSSEVDNNQIYDPSQLPDKVRKATIKKFKFLFTPNTEDYVDRTMNSFVRSTGIRLGSDRSTDFTLKVNLKELKIVDGVGGAPCSAILEWSLLNPERQIVIDGSARGRYTLSPGQNMSDALDKAYSRAIKDIDWDGIARCLGTISKRPDQERGKQVTGEGDTALEHTIIRWYILSTPAGADVSWRIISSTPDVQNTNSNYVGTTPYETTESFDIKGLKYDNTGNVQIEVTCEKAGYLPQKKRFNLRQAIDQREISAKFNLIKDDSSNQ